MDYPYSHKSTSEYEIIYYCTMTEVKRIAKKRLASRRGTVYFPVTGLMRVSWKKSRREEGGGGSTNNGASWCCTHIHTRAPFPLVVFCLLAHVNEKGGGLFVFSCVSNKGIAGANISRMDWKY